MSHKHVYGCTKNLRRLGLSLPEGTEHTDPEEFTARLHVASHALARHHLSGGRQEDDDDNGNLSDQDRDGVDVEYHGREMGTDLETASWIEARAAKVSAEIAGTRQAHADAEEDEIARRAARVSTPRG